MFAAMGLIIAQIFQPLYYSKDCSSYPLSSALENFSEEIHKVPTRQEYLYYLEGELAALAPFAAVIGGEYHHCFSQILNDFLIYKETPNLSSAIHLEKEVEALCSYAPISPAPSFNGAMIIALDQLNSELSQKISDMTPEFLERIKGEEIVLFSLSDVSGRLFEMSFDRFDDEFDTFIENPTEAKREKLLYSLKKLPKLLK